MPSSYRNIITYSFIRSNQEMETERGQALSRDAVIPQVAFHDIIKPRVTIAARQIGGRSFPTADAKNSPFILGAASYLSPFNDRRYAQERISRPDRFHGLDGDRGFPSSGKALSYTLTAPRLGSFFYSASDRRIFPREYFLRKSIPTLSKTHPPKITNNKQLTIN